MRPEDRRDLNLKSTEEINDERSKKKAKADAIAEKKIQSAVEAYLIHLGYERRTPEDICRGMPRRGYQIHLHNTKGNPILLDLLILSHTGKYLELELKNSKGSLSAEQEALVAYGGSIAYGAEEAIQIIRKWDSSL